MFLLGLNLRPAVTSLGSALPDIPTASGIAAVLVALPLWVCGIGGFLTPWLQSATGAQRTVRFALVLLAGAQLVRVADGPVLLVAGTVLVCVAIALIATMLPLLIRGKSTAFSVCYTLSLGCGSTAGALVTPWIVSQSSWRFGLAGWAILAAITVPFSRQLDGGKPNRGTTRKSWSLTVYFGLVSTVTFLVMGWLPAILRDAGVSADVAGACLSLAMILGLPMMWLVPWWVHRESSQHALLALLVLPSVVSVAGLLVAPAFMPWLWASGLGIGMGGIALALTMIPRRADPQGTTALSAMVHGGGYLIAGVGALACGLVHTLTQSWDMSLVMVLVVLCGQAGAGMIVVRPSGKAVPRQRTAAWPERVARISANEPCPRR
ncbi:MFS transporter [Kibdelosporangium philippinense]|uniref:MFS transporter n=1 Tax=Kibdelosporangium philippinense TaxID=211113 RepID=A0ABS8Z5A0_9PSEU|nr:MFS transporter [Kibdelosporangium philippinense]MCE7002672.1 MFS transporter [Kibdelosporangium philippinense]